MRNQSKPSKLTLILATGLMGFATAANAQFDGDKELRNTWVEVDYLNLDIDGFDDDEGGVDKFDDGSGYAIRGSYEFHTNMFVDLSYSSTDADAEFTSGSGDGGNDGSSVTYSSDEDVKRLDIGLGYALPLTIQSGAATDLVMRVGYVDVDYGEFDVGADEQGDEDLEARIDALNEDESDGFTLDASVRSQLLSRLEGSVGLRYTDIERADNVSLIGNVMFEAAPGIGINFGFDAGDEIGTYLLGVRYTPVF